MNTNVIGLALCLSYASALCSIAEEAAAAARQISTGERGRSAYASLSSTSLLIAEPYQLSQISLHPPSRKFLERSPYIGGLDYHARRNLIYWSEMSTGRIKARSLTAAWSSHECEKVFETNPQQWRPRAIAIDCLGDQMYVLDTRGKRVHVLDLESNSSTVIFEGHLKAPTDLGVDPEEAVMFIADGTTILRLNMDGTDAPRPIISHPRYRIKALTLDSANKRVFWSDVAFHRIKSASYDGSNVQVLVKNQIGRGYNVLLGPAQLSYYNGCLYFYDDIYRSISAVEVDHDGAAKSLNTTVRLYDRLNVRAIRVLNSARQTTLA